MENMLSHQKGAVFFLHISQGLLGAHQQLNIDITACANMWGDYWDNLICTVGAHWNLMRPSPEGPLGLSNLIMLKADAC